VSKVAIIRCESYDYSEVKAAVDRGTSLIGGLASLVTPGEKILLKPNLLAPEPPEKCVTTHPMVFKAVAEAFQAAGTHLSYGDSPGWGSPAAVAKKAGLAAVAEELGIPLANFVQGEEVFFAEGYQNKKFVLAQGVREADGLVSLPKLKTHGLMRLTGAIKNQFGCIPGTLKGEYHVKLPAVNEFAQMLIDLNLAIRPRLYIMDGIMAMEGNGPRGGNPKPMNILLISVDPVALDATICRLVQLNPEYIPTLQLGLSSGLGSMQDIELVGDDINQFINPGFDVKHENATGARVPAVALLNNLLVPKPFIIENNCIRCGVCVQSCPVKPKAVDWASSDHDNTPVYYYERCIRCYCCQEMCPEHAIEIKSSWLRQFLNRLPLGLG